MDLQTIQAPTRISVWAEAVEEVAIIIATAYISTRAGG